jgi:divalent metal cation (Fe/Co/Zn/Cd) transporter
VERICLEDEDVERVVRIMGVHLGPDDILLTLGLEFAAGHDIGEAARAVDRIERRIREADPRVTRVFVEPEVSTDPGGLETPF